MSRANSRRHARYRTYRAVLSSRHALFRLDPASLAFAFDSFILGLRFRLPPFPRFPLLLRLLLLRIFTVRRGLCRLWLCRLGCGADPDAFAVDEFRERLSRFDAGRARLFGKELATQSRSDDEVAEGLQATSSFEGRKRLRQVSGRGDAATGGRSGRLRRGSRFEMRASEHVS